MQVKRTKKELGNCHMLRMVWHRSIPYWEAMHRAKVAPNQYKCEGCNKVFKLREVQVDHIDPVIDPVEGWQGLQSFATRLFCPSNRLRVLDQDSCHKSITLAQNKIRRENS